MAGYDTRRLAEILRDGIYIVPEYQRNYAWEEDQFNDLWEDLESLGPDKTRDHYMGTLIVKLTGTKTKMGKTYKCFELIDGQQRLTSLIILLYCISERLDSLGHEEARKTAKNIMSEYIYDQDTDIYKLRLNGGDDGFFRDVILQPPSGEMAGRSPETDSEKRLKEAKDFFSKKVNSLDYEKLQEVIYKVLNKIVAIRYEVETDAEAGLIFEVVNDRGRPLSQLDKIKNYLIYLSYKGDYENLAHDINESWGKIFKNIAPIKNFDEEQLLRFHWIMYTGESREYDVHRRLKAKLKGTQDILLWIKDYVRSLQEASLVFQKLNNPEGAFPEGRDRLFGLRWLDVMASFMPLLTACRIVCKDAPDLFSKVVSACEVFAFRVYTVANRRSDTGQYTFHRHAYQLFHQRGSPRGKLESQCDKIVSNIAEVTREYCSDAQLADGLKNQDILKWMGEDAVIYLLYELERDKCYEAKEPPLQWKDLEKARKDGKLTIEHIWPKTPMDYDSWPQEAKDKHKLYVDQIGNLTLTFWNPELSNKDFSEKKQKYGESRLLIQRELAKWDRWTPKEIEERTKEIIDFAKRRWAISEAKR